MKSRCFFIATSWNDGAISNQFRALSNHLVERGHRVVILVTGQNKWAAEDHESNPSIYAWPSLRPTNFRDAVFLYKLIREYRPDCLISNFSADNVMLLVGWLMKVPSRVAWYHTLISQIEIDCEVSGFKARLVKLRKQAVYRMATFIVSVSAACREDVQRVFQTPERKCLVLHNSLGDPLPGLRLDQTQSAQHKVVCVGRLHPTKGQDTLIRALAILKQLVPDIAVEFIGDGPFRENCLQLARELGVEDACSFEGDLHHDEVLNRMALANATVVPSRSEGFGLVNIESLAVGTPVVASCVGGIVEVIRDGVDGFLVPPDNPEVLAEKLLSLLSNSHLRRTMSRNARERFLTTFEQSKVVKEQADWFEKIVYDGSGLARRMPGWVGERAGLGAASIFGIFGSKDW